MLSLIMILKIDFTHFILCLKNVLFISFFRSEFGLDYRTDVSIIEDWVEDGETILSEFRINIW